MLLVIDVGNTNIVAGVIDENNNIKTHWRFSTDRSKTADEFGMLLCGTFEHSGVDLQSITAIIISSVVPPVSVPIQHMCQRYFGVEPLIVGPGIKSGIAVRYDNPRDVGADRIVNSVAALSKYGSLGKPMIVIDFGTATTFDVLMPNGEYLGGAIAPGIGISSEALFNRTAKLPRIELVRPNKVICRSTVRSMQSGIMFGYVGLMEGIVTRMKEELGGEAYVIATGGFANAMASDSKMIDAVEPFLTLDGLRILYEKNKKPELV